MRRDKKKKKFCSIFDQFLSFTGYLTGGVILLSMLIICVNVLLRYIFNRPIAGAEEITEYCMLFITFIGSAWLLREKGHVRMDILFERVKPKTQSLLGVITSLMGILIASTLTWYGGRVTWESFKHHSYFSSVLEFPIAPIFAIIVFGSFLLLIQFIRQAIVSLKDWRTTK